MCLLLRRRLDEICHGVICVKLAYLIDERVATVHTRIGGGFESLDGLGEVGALGRKDCACIVGFGSVAGFEQMALCLVELSALHVVVGSVEVEHRIVGVDLDGSLENLAIFVRAFGVGLREGVEVYVAQTRRIGLESVAYLVDVCICLDGIFDSVVRVSQPRVDFLEDYGVVLWEADLDFAVARVVAERAVDNVDDLTAVFDGEVEASRSDSCGDRPSPQGRSLK